MKRRSAQQSFAFDDGRVAVVPYTPEPAAAIVEPPPARVEVLDQWMFGNTAIITGRRAGAELPGTVKRLESGYRVIIAGKATVIDAEDERAAFLAVAGKG